MLYEPYLKPKSRLRRRLVVERREIRNQVTRSVPVLLSKMVKTEASTWISSTVT